MRRNASMKKNNLIFITIFISTLFFSCATHITMDKIQSIQRGTAHKQLKSLLQKKPTMHFKINDDNNLFLVEIYPMQTGTQTSSYYVAPTQYAPGGMRTIQVPVTSEYVFSFKDKKLLFWGFINELYKSEDKEILQLAPKITEKFDKSNERKWDEDDE